MGKATNRRDEGIAGASVARDASLLACALRAVHRAHRELT
jgi:hypothetical protein